MKTMTRTDAGFCGHVRAALLVAMAVSAAHSGGKVFWEGNVDTDVPQVQVKAVCYEQEYDREIVHCRFRVANNTQDTVKEFTASFFYWFKNAVASTSLYASTPIPGHAEVKTGNSCDAYVSISKLGRAKAVVQSVNGVQIPHFKQRREQATIGLRG